MATTLGIEAVPEKWSLADLRDPSAAPRQVHKAAALFPRLDADETIDG
jgi:hypothetical protein